jgi:hypothetical protein
LELKYTDKPSDVYSGTALTKTGHKSWPPIVAVAQEPIWRDRSVLDRQWFAGYNRHGLSKSYARQPIEREKGIRQCFAGLA